MKLSHEDLLRIRTGFAACRSAGIESVVISENQIRGASPSSKSAIISKIGVSTGDARIGIGKIADFEKRLAVFDGEIFAEGVVNQNNDCSLLTFKSGRTSMQFRCTSEKFIKYPKEMLDTPICTFVVEKAEVMQIVRAIRTLDAEAVSLQIRAQDLSIHLECTSATNESFKTTFVNVAEFEDDAENIVHSFEGARLAQILDAAVKDSTSADVVLGEAGSLTVILGGHTVVMMPEANYEGEDDE